MEQLIPPIPPDTRVTCACTKRGEIEIKVNKKRRGKVWKTTYIVFLLAGTVASVALMLQPLFEPFTIGVTLAVVTLMALLLFVSVQRSRTNSCGVREATLWIYNANRVIRRQRCFAAGDIVAIEPVEGVDVEVVYRDPSSGWRSDRLNFFGGYEQNRWLARLLAMHLDLQPLPNRFIAREPANAPDGIQYSFGTTRDIAKVQNPDALGEKEIVRTTLSDGAEQFRIARGAFFSRQSIIAGSIFFGIVAILLIVPSPVSRVIGGLLGALVIWGILASAWRHCTRIKLETRPGHAVITIRTPTRQRQIHVGASDYIGVWNEYGELRALQADQHIVRLLRRESIFSMEEFARRINAALDLMPIAMPLDPLQGSDVGELDEEEGDVESVRAPVAGPPVEAPTGTAPRSSVLLSGDYPDRWQIEKPARRSSLVRPVAVVGAAALFTAFLTHVSAIDWHSFGGVVFAWIILLIFLNKSFVAGLFTPTLFVDGENVRFCRPTLLGFQNPTCNRWAVGGLSIVRSPRRVRNGSLCRASLALTLRNRRAIQLFDDLPEEDARWVAGLFASALGMTASR